MINFLSINYLLQLQMDTHESGINLLIWLSTKTMKIPLMIKLVYKALLHIIIRWNKWEKFAVCWGGKWCRKRRLVSKHLSSRGWLAGLCNNIRLLKELGIRNRAIKQASETTECCSQWLWMKRKDPSWAPREKGTHKQIWSARGGPASAECIVNKRHDWWCVPINICWWLTYQQQVSAENLLQI